MLPVENGVKRTKHIGTVVVFSWFDARHADLHQKGTKIRMETMSWR